MNKKLPSKDEKKVEKLSRLWKSWKKRYPTTDDFDYFVPHRISALLTQSRQEWQEELIGEVNKKYRIYFRKANGNCSYCDLCQDECACAGYNSAVYDILHILKGDHD